MAIAPYYGRILSIAVTFEWDSVKAEANLKKHGVSFAEAQLVFLDKKACKRPRQAP